MNCELCNSSDEKQPFYPEISIVKCPNCGLVFYNGESIGGASLYNKEYFNGKEYFDYVSEKNIIQYNFSRFIKFLSKLVPRGRLFEIGCAYGFFLELAQKYWTVSGVDVVPEGVQHARDMLHLDVLLADFLSLEDPPESFDIICMWDTVEHLQHPVRFIEKAGQWLKPGGILVMTTPNIDSYVARLRKKRWRQIHPPTHLYYFSVQTLSSAVKKAGLEVIQTSHVGYYRSLKFMLHRIFVLKNGNLKWLYRALTLNEKLDFPIYLNLWDTMMLIAQNRRP